jgi:hypothetical protein
MRRRLGPDKRPRWNDPDLKVPYDGKLYDQEEYRKLCEKQLIVDRAYLSWRDDPTYDLRKKKSNV